MKKKIILRNRQSPGDITVLTAVLRDIHKLHPEKYLTDVDVPSRALFANNPYITDLKGDKDAEVIQCNYPLIQQSNQAPWHFLHAFHYDVGETLDIELWPTEFKGDIHLSEEEKREPPKIPGKYWLIIAGGKEDVTVKVWSLSRYQQLVGGMPDTHFVQVGHTGPGHFHQVLKGENVTNLLNKTRDVRELIKLVYHAEGVVCGLTFLMHLAAAVPMKDGMGKTRKAVIIAGGREPANWTKYPTHQFLSTIGTLPCCDNGGCWKNRTKAIETGNEKSDKQNNHPDRLCVATVGNDPKCMHKITVDNVMDAMNLYERNDAPKKGRKPVLNPKVAYLSYSTNNIGDDAQSEALYQVLGEPDLYVNRDRFNDYNLKGGIKLIANGFFACGSFPPPKNFDATYVALCASSINETKHLGCVEHLKQCEPIGCRDQHTVKWCEDRGIEAYFASCPTILLEREVEYDPDGPVIFVDVDPALLPPIAAASVCITNRVNPRWFATQDMRRERARENLLNYQKASLVITNRLHVAMPCLGMGVPLIMTLEGVEEWSKFRMTALPPWLHLYNKEGLASVSMNPNDHRYEDVTASWKEMVRDSLDERLAL